MADRPAAAAIAAALLAVSAAAETASRPGSAAPLLEATAPGGEIIVFVPSGSANGRFLISTTNDAAAYRRWAEESRPGKGIALRWDSEPFEMDVADRTLLAWIREGDEGTDPAGRFRYAVVSNPVPATGRVTLLLKNAPDAKDFAPDCCASNVWLLSRDTLFARWEECAKQQGGAADVRRAFRALDRRFGSSPEWRAAADDFAAKPELCAAIRFRNGKQAPVRVRIGGATQNIRPGDSWDWKPDASLRTGEVEWKARDLGDGRSGDDDWEWRADRVAFNSMGDDVLVDLSGPCGRLKPPPFLAFPDGALPSGVDLRAELRYADEARAVPAVIVERGGRRGVECEPGREVRQCIVRADGWKNASFSPSDRSAVFVRGQSASFNEARMERALAPWKDGAVRIAWNGFEGEVRILAKSGEQTIVDQTIAPGTEIVPIPLDERLRALPASETQVSVSWWSGEKKLGDKSCSVRRGVLPENIAVALPAPAPEVPWPDRKRVEAAHDWFSVNQTGVAYSQIYWLENTSTINPAPQRRRDAKRELFRLLGFRPEVWSDFHTEWRGFEATFDAMVSHIESCPGCDAHQSSLPARAEALRSLGATTELITSLTAWPKEGNLNGFVTEWWKECLDVLNNDILAVGSNPGRNWTISLERWNGGWNGGADPQRPKTMFAEAFVHILCCPGCANCRPFRDDMLREKTFEARRAALFRALMKHGWNWGQTPRPKDDEIDRILQKFTSKTEGAK